MARKRGKARGRQSYEDVVLVAPVTVPYERYSLRSAHWFVAQAIARLIDASGVEKDDIDGLCLGSFTLFPDTAIGVADHLGLSLRWLDHLPMGGMAAVLSLRRAARAVQCGDADIVACVGADTNHVDSFRLSLGSFSVFARDAMFPYAAGGPNANFAFLTEHYMRRRGVTRADFGKLCVAQRRNALGYPNALFRKPLTIEEYLHARPVVEPIHLFDCVMPCAGAEAFLVMSRELAEELELPYARVLATSERHNAFAEDPIQTRGGWALDRAELFGSAGIEPRDVDLVQTYDDYPVMSLIQLEDLGFIPDGDVVRFVRQHEFTVDGTFPINTSGGQLSVGQAGCGGGYLGLVEAVRQLTKQNLARPVARARFAMVVGFGMVNYDRGLCSGAAILAAAQS
jgi:acetyl-CoA acetyltransferase